MAEGSRAVRFRMRCWWASRKRQGRAVVKPRPGRSASDGVDARGEVLQACAAVERGQDVDLITAVLFTVGAEAVLMVGDVEVLVSADLTPADIHRRIASATPGRHLAPSVPDTSALIYDISAGGHVAWVWLLQYLGNFYRTALRDDPRPGRIDEVRLAEDLARITARIDGGHPVVYTVALDGSIDVMDVCFDIRYSLLNGLDHL